MGLTKKAMTVAVATSIVGGFATTVLAAPNDAVYRVYNPNSGLHHYTTSVAERNALVGLGWVEGGEVFNTGSETVTLYKVYNPNDGNHHITESASEVSYLVSLGWVNEGVAWKQGTENTVYRIYNPNSGEHVYTTSKFEANAAIAAGWKNEGTAWGTKDNGDDTDNSVYYRTVKAVGTLEDLNDRKEVTFTIQGELTSSARDYVRAQVKANNVFGSIVEVTSEVVDHEDEVVTPMPFAGFDINGTTEKDTKFTIVVDVENENEVVLTDSDISIKLDGSKLKLESGAKSDNIKVVIAATGSDTTDPTDPEEKQTPLEISDVVVPGTELTDESREAIELTIQEEVEDAINSAISTETRATKAAPVVVVKGSYEDGVGTTFTTTVTGVYGENINGDITVPEFTITADEIVYADDSKSADLVVNITITDRKSVV